MNLTLNPFKPSVGPFATSKPGISSIPNVKLPRFSGESQAEDTFRRTELTKQLWAFLQQSEKSQGTGGPSLEFASDHNTSVHPEYLMAILAACLQHNASYGHGQFTKSTEERVKEVFGPKTIFVPIATGTGSVNVALATLMGPTEKAVASDLCHAHALEGNALAISTHTVPLMVPSNKGKITVKDVENTLSDYKRPGIPLVSRPKVLYIAQPTEIGTLYEPGEIKALADYAHANDMLLFVDGARFWNAAAALRRKYPERQYTMKNLTADLGVDAMTLGGTKNGMLTCESVLYFDNGQSKIAQELFSDKRFRGDVEIWKRQLFSRTSKTEPYSAQYLRALQPEEGQENFGVALADHANRLASYLYEGMSQVKGVKTIPSRAVDTNSAFLLLPKGWYPEFKKAYGGFDQFSAPEVQKHYPHHQLVRYMTGATSTKAGADRMIRYAESLALKHGSGKE